MYPTKTLNISKAQLKTGFVFFLVLVWLIPFLIELLCVKVQMPNPNSIGTKPLSAMNNVLAAYANNNRYSAFVLIFFNNAKVLLYNIAGGSSLGICTFFNLIVNGCAAAFDFGNAHKMGLSWTTIAIHTLPHSIELIGIWLSGGIGFSIAKK